MIFWYPYTHISPISSQTFWLTRLFVYILIHGQVELHLIVDEEDDIHELDGRVVAQDGVVWLHNGGRDLKIKWHFSSNNKRSIQEKIK